MKSHAHGLGLVGGLLLAFSSGCEGEVSEIGAVHRDLPTAGGSGGEPAALGESCTPGDEWIPEYSGYSTSEINIADRFAGCASGICLVNHFQGRTNCPYGQADPDDPEQLESPACLLPDGRARVGVEVLPQLVDRRAEDTIHCSCRCDGPEGTGPFCTCGEGLECQHLIDDLGLDPPGVHYAGSYCIKPGTLFDPATSGQEGCDWRKKNCGPG